MSTPENEIDQLASMALTGDLIDMEDGTVFGFREDCPQVAVYHINDNRPNAPVATHQLPGRCFLAQKNSAWLVAPTDAKVQPYADRLTQLLVDRAADPHFDYIRALMAVEVPHVEP